MPRMERTIDHNGQVRSGPPGAWWSHLQPRPGAGGFSPEIPPARAAAWNLFLAVLVLSSAAVTHLAGTPWSTVGAVLGGAVLLGLVLVLVVTPISRARLAAPARHLREQDRTAPAQSRPVLPIRAAGERAT